MRKFAILLLCSVAFAQTKLHDIEARQFKPNCADGINYCNEGTMTLGGTITTKPEVIKAPEEGLIRAEKMTDAEFDDLWLAKQALEAIKNKIAAAHNMSINYGWRNGWYSSGMICNNDFEIKDKFLLYSQHCTPLVVNTYWTTQPLGTPNFYFTNTSP